MLKAFSQKCAEQKRDFQSCHTTNLQPDVLIQVYTFLRHAFSEKTLDCLFTGRKVDLFTTFPSPTHPRILNLAVPPQEQRHTVSLRGIQVHQPMKRRHHRNWAGLMTAGKICIWIHAERPLRRFYELTLCASMM